MASIEREIEQAILAQKRWADLDNRMRDLIGSSQEYDKKILSYSIENQLRYRGNLVRFVVNNEYDYYRELLKYSINHLMLFPYHLSDFLITGMRITPFQYYLSTMAKIIEQEKSYDTLPNFTAADCLRLLGIGRNQYIDIMNELRSTHSRFLGIGMRRNAKDLLPNKPDKNVPIEPWWFINAGYITEDDVRSMVTSAERSIIDRLVTPDGLSNQILAFELDQELVRSLYLKGLIYLDVPIYDDDLIVVPPLEGFVMNRVLGDYFETLLYKIFVSIDQNTPVSELASILDLDIRLVKNAISMYCRLRFAYKKNIYIDVEKCHPSWREMLDKYREMGINVSPQTTLKTSSHLTDFISELASVEEFDHGTEVDAEVNPSTSDFTLINDSTKSQMLHSPTTHILSPQPTSQHPGTKKIVFFYDSNLAAFLMMGNLSSKLKNHAVTMFEVGKLSDEWIDSLLVELSKIKCDSIEDDGYEAKRYYIHALMLHRTINFIRETFNIVTSHQELSQDTNDTSRVGLDLVRVESLSNLDHEACERFLKKNYQLLISVAPLNQDIKLSQSASLPHLGPGSPLINSLWFRLYMYHITGFGPTSLLMVQGFQLSDIPDVLKEHKVLLINHWNREPTCVSTKSALNAINDALTHCPVLVQAYPMHPVGGDLINSDEKVFIPLPLLADNDMTQFDEESVDHQPKNTDEEDEFFSNEQLRINSPVESLREEPAVIKLSQSLDLHRCCGYITLLRSAESVEKLVRENDKICSFGSRRKSDLHPSSPNESKLPLIDFSSEKSRETYTLFDCHFGIPLFDRFLNREVRNRIKTSDLCNPNSLNELVKATSDLNDKIQQFVDKYSCSNDMEGIDMSNCGDQRHFFSFPDTEQFKCPVPRPAKNLIFHNGTLSTFEEIL